MKNTSKPVRSIASRRSARGFTLIEAIVVVVIIGVLATLIAPRLIDKIGKSKRAVAEGNAAALANALHSYMAEHGNPPDGATIDILWERPSEIDAKTWQPYVNSADALKDPWGSKFVLIIPGVKNFDFDIVSYGADGKPGGDGDNADVVKP